ncbi:hypothetical protein [Aureimonas altamirensis]|uniref:hypothetical protein n=1 Tax=Aureimonas altamirensis TaxID=370622 RepID=UPI0025563826|nr:hypothetical protein [Aureimonas altamirensis]
MPHGWALVKAILVASFAALLGVLFGVHLFIPAGIIEWIFGIEVGTLWVRAQFVGSGFGAIAAIVSARDLYTKLRSRKSSKPATFPA